MALLRIDPGALRHELTVEKQWDTVEYSGKATTTWAAQQPDPIRAHIEPLSGQELIEAQALAANARHRVTIRYWEGLEPKTHRFKFGSRTLNILAVLNIDERCEQMTVLCGEDV